MNPAAIKNVRPAFVFAIALAACVVTETAITASDAQACGPIEPEDMVSMMINSHFASLNSHDREAMLSVWNPKSTVVSLSQPVLVEPVETAATRWLSAKKPVTFQIQKIDVTDKEKMATALVSVVFDGVKHEDSMVFVRGDGRNSWRIAGKSSRPVALAAVKASNASLRY